MTVFEAYNKVFDNLKLIYDSREAKTIAAILIEHITGLSNTERLIKKEKQFSNEEESLFNSSLRDLSKGKPLQYVLQEALFAGMKFYVDENVLIPRPETEELVNWVLEDEKKKNAAAAILDIATGSGCIAIALQKKLPFATVTALDISKKAVEVAKKNADLNNAAINFIQADILNHEQTRNLDLFDIIVSNPPYVTENEAEKMHKNVLLYEPPEALFVPNNDPLLFYRKIAEFAIRHLNKKGSIYFEINEMFGEEIADILKEKKFTCIEIKKDMHGKNRMVKALR